MSVLILIRIPNFSRGIIHINKLLNSVFPGYQNYSDLAWLALSVSASRGSETADFGLNNSECPAKPHLIIPNYLYCFATYALTGACFYFR